MSELVAKSLNTPGARPATQARKREILQSALRCFTSTGVERTSVQDICQAADCSVGSLYHHFGSKEGVAGELFLNGVEMVNADLLRRLERCRTVTSSVKMVVIQYSDWMTEHPQLARFLHSGEVEFTRHARAELRQVYREHIEAVFQHFDEYVRSEQMRRLPLDTYVPLISGPIRDYTRQWLSGRVHAEPARVKAIFAAAAWNAVKV